MALPAKRPEQLVGAVFRSRDVRASGLLTRRQLEGDAWRRLFRGVYADAGLPVDHALRCRAARLLLPPGAAVAGLSAAYEHGVRLAADGDPVEVIVPRGRRFGPVAGCGSAPPSWPPAMSRIGAPRQPGRRSTWRWGGT